MTKIIGIRSYIVSQDGVNTHMSAYGKIIDLHHKTWILPSFIGWGWHPYVSLRKNYWLSLCGNLQIIDPTNTGYVTKCWHSGTSNCAELILQAPPNLYPVVLEGLVRMKTFFTLLLGVACSVSKTESSSSSEVRNYNRWETNKQMRETIDPKNWNFKNRKIRCQIMWFNRFFAIFSQKSN